MVIICSVSYKQELWKSFLVPDFTTAMSLAWVWCINRKRISRRINLYTAHLPHFHESINKFANIRKNRVFVVFDNGILINWEKSQIKGETWRQVTISILQIKIYNFTHFSAGTANSVKNSMGCVIVIVCQGSNLTLYMLEVCTLCIDTQSGAKRHCCCTAVITSTQKYIF